MNQLFLFQPVIGHFHHSLIGIAVFDGIADELKSLKKSFLIFQRTVRNIILTMKNYNALVQHNRELHLLEHAVVLFFRI